LTDRSAVAIGETVVAAILWGTSFPVVSYGIAHGLDPRLFVFLRFGTAAPLMVIAALAMGKRILPTFRIKAVWVLGLLNAAGFLCQFVGQTMTGPAVAALLVNLSVLVTAAGSAAVLKEKFGAAKTAGVVLALVGIVLLTTEGNLAQVSGGVLTGDALYLLAALCWGWYMIYNKKATEEEKWDPLSVSVAIVALTALFVSPALLTLGTVAPVSPTSWALIFYAAVFNTAVPFVLYQLGLRFLTATTSAVVLMLEIVTALVISLLFMGEVFNAFSVLGALAVFVSIYLVSANEGSGKSLSVVALGGKDERSRG
jgi:drug/metabolite transporter (DMT)-like permease